MHSHLGMRFVALAALIAGLAPLSVATAAQSAPRPDTAHRAASAATPPVVASATAHMVVNRHGSTKPTSVGFNIFDTGSSSALVDSLPAGTRAMVWLGQKCPTKADAKFRAVVDRLSRNKRVYGYYLSDEPHVASCPRAAAALRSRATYIRTASGGAQRSFVVLSVPADYKAFAPARTGVSLIGLDPYPCSDNNPTCDISMIGSKVQRAVNAGVPRSQIVPVYQTFGQGRIKGGYYRMPTVAQLQKMLAAWVKAVPNAQLDYAYGWGNQTTSNPTLVDAPRLQTVLHRYFTG